MKFLGIRNCHDSNVTYTDGTKVKYFKLERKNQIKHYRWDSNNVPFITSDDTRHLLEQAKETLEIDFKDLDAVCFSMANALEYKSVGDLELFKKIDKEKSPIWSQFDCPIYDIDHHYAHSLSCWPLVDVSTAANSFVIDGLGDCFRSSTFFKNNKIVDYINISQPFMTDVYDLSGLSVLLIKIGTELGINGLNLDIPGKLMALQSFHNLNSQFINDIFNKVELVEYQQMKEFYQLCVEELNKQTFDKRQTLINLAHLLHVFGERKLPKYMANYLENSTDIITYSGGTAQNTVINSKLKESFPNIVIPPHCPDDGISLGCVEFLRQHYTQPAFDNSNFPFWQSDEAPDTQPSASTIDKTAELLARGKIVGWYQGYGEIGPRALGNRSILMDPTVKNGKEIINSKVKHRESYRPFGASVLKEHTNEIFECDYESPYMLYNVVCRDTERYQSITHVDGTCRIQTVNHDPQNEMYYSLIDRFREKTGVPMLLNTSLNVDGKPIAGYMQDAKTLLETTELDAIVVGNDMIVKD